MFTTINKMAAGTEENERDVAVPPALQLLMISLVSMFSSLIISSYVWIIVTVARTRSLHTASNCFLVSLAVSLVTMGLSSIPTIVFFTAIETYTSPLIFIMTWMICFTFTGYFLNAILLAADKWLKISRPFLYARVVTRNKCTVCLSGVWATALLGSLIIAIVHTLNLELTNIKNSIFGSFSVIFLVHSYYLVLPSVIVITALNIGINRIARQQARDVVPAAVRHHQQPRIADPESAAVPEPQFQPDFADRQRAIHTKSTRQFSIFLLSFPITWLPLVPLCHILYVTETLAENTAFVVVLMIYFSSLIFHSAFGTLILTLLQKNYRQILKRNTRTVSEKMHCSGRR